MKKYRNSVKICHEGEGEAQAHAFGLLALFIKKLIFLPATYIFSRAITHWILSINTLKSIKLSKKNRLAAWVILKLK